MIGVKQTILDPEQGNCQAACIASILEVDLDDIPDKPEASWDERSRIWAEWLHEHYRLATLTFPWTADGIFPGFSILGVVSPRFPDRLHAVVAYSGRPVFDPHPSVDRAYIETYDIKEVTVFYCTNPREIVARSASDHPGSRFRKRP